MKILVIRAKNVRVILFSAVASLLLLAVLFYTLSSGAVSVFNTDKDLPIYSVDIPEKKAAITFDCAWGAGN